MRRHIAARRKARIEARQKKKEMAGQKQACRNAAQLSAEISMLQSALRLKNQEIESLKAANASLISENVVLRSSYECLLMQANTPWQ